MIEFQGAMTSTDYTPMLAALTALYVAIRDAWAAFRKIKTKGR